MLDGKGKGDKAGYADSRGAVVQGALAEAREGLQQRDFLLAARDKAGVRQQSQAHRLRKELGRTACELGLVFDKVCRPHQ